jgi:hypothetical protein
VNEQEKFNFQLYFIVRPFMKIGWLVIFLFAATTLIAQDIELIGVQEIYRGQIGETLVAPIKIKNTSEKAISLVVRRTSSQIGAMQKNYYCLDSRCLDAKADDYSFRLEAGQTLNTFNIAFEPGLSPGVSSIHYLVFNKNTPAESVEFDLNFHIEERSAREQIFSSKEITLFDLYPNPVSDFAHMDYKIHNDQVKAKIVLHNLLGSSIEELTLEPLEMRLKIRADNLDAGIYFYTLYVDNEVLITRKLIVKK